MIRKNKDKILAAAVFHFSDIEWLDKFIELGIYIGVNGCMFRD